MINEKELALRCSRTDRQAQRLLYETYARYLLGVCLRYVNDHNTAQDLMHDGFIQILTHFHQFEWRGEGSLKAWLYRVQHNVILEYLRRHERLQEVLSIDEHPELTESTPEPESICDIPHDILLRLIRELPTGYRTVFNLYVIDGYSHSQIAQLLGIAERSSSSQLVHARRLLATRINAWRKENL